MYSCDLFPPIVTGILEGKLYMAKHWTLSTALENSKLPGLMGDLYAKARAHEGSEQKGVKKNMEAYQQLAQTPFL